MVSDKLGEKAGTDPCSPQIRWQEHGGGRMGLWDCILYLLTLAILSHIIGEELPRHWFDPDKRPFTSFAWEKEGRFYEKLGIRWWKDRVPDVSRADPKMRRKQLSAVRGREDLVALLRETCVAEAVHVALILLSPPLLWLWPGVGGVCVWAVDVLLGNLPFILIQRYNRPRLKALLNGHRRRERKKEAIHEDSDTHL
ncbi:MAG: hypothetical protein ACI3WR_04610 [Oscillospiraceae bacterium]